MARPSNVNGLVFVATYLKYCGVSPGPMNNLCAPLPDGYMCLTKYCGVSLMNDLCLFDWDMPYDLGLKISFSLELHILRGNVIQL
jgi:hypothetical protein